MSTLLSDSRSQFQELLLSFLWRQWSALGVAGHAQSKDDRVIDPEALLLFTCSIGRRDPRLFDEVVDWLHVNGSFLNILRLKTILKQERFPVGRVLGAIAGLLNRGTEALKWRSLAAASAHGLNPEALFYFQDGKAMEPLGQPDAHFGSYGLLRGPLKLRGYSRKFRPTLPTSLILQLRALVGPSARSEIIAYLLTHERAHASEIARATYYQQKTVFDTLAIMHASGVVQYQSVGREKHYWLKPEPWRALLNHEGPTPVWVTWAPLFSALDQIWTALNDERLLKHTDLLFVSSELRQLMEQVRPSIERAGFAKALSDPRQYLGESFAAAFLADLTRLLD